MILIVAVSWTIIDSLFYSLRLAEQPIPTKYALFQKHTTETIVLCEINVFFLSMMMAYFLVFFMKNFFRKTSLWINMFLKAIILIGEIGIIKKDLVMSGDTMNTVARIRTACNELNQKYIVSKDFLERIQLKDWQVEALGPIELKGKNASVELLALKI